MLMRIWLSYTFISPTTSSPHYPVDVFISHLLVNLKSVIILLWLSNIVYTRTKQSITTMLPFEFFLGIIIVSLLKIYLVFYGPFLFSEFFFRSVDTQWIFFYQWSNIPDNLSFQFDYFLEASFWSPLPSCFCLVWLLAPQSGNMADTSLLFNFGYSDSRIPMSVSSLVIFLQLFQVFSGWPGASHLTFLVLSFLTGEVEQCLCLITYLCEGQWENVCGHTLLLEKYNKIMLYEKIRSLD